MFISMVLVTRVGLNNLNNRSVMKYTFLFVFMYVFCLTACTSDDGEKAAARLELSATNFSIVQGGGEETVNITATWDIRHTATKY